ncbi:hypothetical protein B8281_15885 [Cellulosimicrobium sp. TH-20]|uniref:bifunctional DNA primase/polymerase n=1 Tax=Cellulosimicrobium sp. TH-20 TaxID=1980001 RepID=UPI000A17E5E3|nr:bifunctional DNA primase/polymerase [Cellulosimicrobium sp. TH-20]ARK05975.1 hypothetical protein B8281_15885 [Cellulosimicrobium sp. TH-20]
MTSRPADSVQYGYLESAGEAFLAINPDDTEDAKADNGEWVPNNALVELTLFVSESGTDKRPLVCTGNRRCSHVACSMLWRLPSWSTSDIDQIAAALAAHEEERPELTAFLGIRPMGNLLVIDIDDQEAADWLVRHTGIRLEEHYTQVTPKGFHVYLQCDPGKRYRVPTIPGEARAAIDLRYEAAGSHQFVVAPESYRGDGYEYKALNSHITWGTFRREEAVLELLAAPEQPPAPTRERTRTSDAPAPVNGGLGAQLRALRRAAEIADARDLTVARMATMGSGASRLACSFWNVCLASGLSVAEAVSLAYDHEPVLAYWAWHDHPGERGRSVATRSATKAYETASFTRHHREVTHFDGAEALRRARELWPEWDRRVHLLEWIIDLCNRVQRPVVDVGWAQAGEVAEVSTRQGGNLLNALMGAGLLTMEADFLAPTFEDGKRVDGLVRSYSVTGMTAHVPEEADGVTSLRNENGCPIRDSLGTDFSHALSPQGKERAGAPSTSESLGEQPVYAGSARTRQGRSSAQARLRVGGISTGNQANGSGQNQAGTRRSFGSQPGRPGCDPGGSSQARPPPR